MHPLARRRTRAYLRDCIGYLGIAAATVPFGVAAQSQGWGRSQVFVWAVSAVPPVIATTVAARRESGTAAATLGKVQRGLQVHARAGMPVGLGGALLRNTVKIAIPWQVGHTVAVGAAFGGFEVGDPVTLAAAVITYPLLAVMIATGVLGEGRALHDRVAGTVVTSGSVRLSG